MSLTSYLAAPSRDFYCILKGCEGILMNIRADVKHFLRLFVKKTAAPPFRGQLRLDRRRAMG